MHIADIQLETRALVDADSSSYPDAILLRRENAAYEEIIGDLIAIDKNWKFDDSNYTDLPIGTANLVDGQKDYAFNVTLLAIERIEIQDANGNWHKLNPVDEKTINEALDEYKSTDGIPSEYSVRGNTIFLKSAPATASVTITAGLKVYFRRTADVFTSAQVTTGTKVPGFASPYHILICYKAALPYARSYKPDLVPSFEREIERLHTKLIAHYNNQNKDKESRMTPAYQNNR